MPSLPLNVLNKAPDCVPCDPGLLGSLVRSSLSARAHAQGQNVGYGGGATRATPSKPGNVVGGFKFGITNPGEKRSRVGRPADLVVKQEDIWVSSLC
jgi:hypothetical protein